MANQGYILIHRSIMDKDDYLGHKFSTKEAWIDLLLLANFTDNRDSLRGVFYDVKRGQVGHSMLTLSERWQWSRGRVKRFLNELEIRQQIGTKKIQGGKFLTTIITITNYEQYQQWNGETEQQTDQQTDSRRTADGPITNNVNNENNVNKEKKGKKRAKKKKAEDGAEAALIYPDCVSQELIDKYIDNRVIIKKTMTHYAKELFLLKIQKFHDKGQDVKTLIEKAIIAGWSDIYEDKANGKNNRGSKSEPVKKAGTKSGREEKYIEGRQTEITFDD